jgi:hypothetical protein
MIVGCDYPGFQQIAFVDAETGGLAGRRLTHREEAEQFHDNSRGGGYALGWKPAEIHAGLSVC